MSELRKQSTTSTASTTPPPRPAASPAEECCGGGYFSYPPSRPSRPIFLTARLTVVFMSLVLVGLASATLFINRGKVWSTPVYTPSFSCFFQNFIESICIVRWNRRAGRYWRAGYDGLLSIGCAIAFGFLIKFTGPDVLRTSPDSSNVTQAVGLAILLAMGTNMVLQFGIAMSGVRDIVRKHAARRVTSTV